VTGWKKLRAVANHFVRMPTGAGEKLIASRRNRCLDYYLKLTGCDFDFAGYLLCGDSDVVPE
jgi:hypothetical protein